jgi:spore coat polysaccharide biosynthesis protein SpsF
VSHAPHVRLRPVESDDVARLWRWRNDPAARAASFDEREIPLDTHREWFEATRRRADRALYIAEADGTAAAALRLDLDGAAAEVSINVAPEWRGRGVGVAALVTLSREAFGVRGLAGLTARVKADNAISRVVFERAGFAPSGGTPGVLHLARTHRPRIVATIQARLGSTRLPGKVLRPAARRPLLAWILDRLRAATELDGVQLATSTAPADDALAAFAAEHGVACVRGSEDDVVQRLGAAACRAGADAIVRITGDCPLVDPAIVDTVVRAFRARPWELDYASNVYPSTFPHGLDVEVLGRALLERLDREIDDAFYRDWFSAFVREHPERFAIVNVEAEVDRHELRWTVDHPEDLVFVDEVFRRLGADGHVFGMGDVLALLEREPALRDINRHLEDPAIVRGIRSHTYHRLLAEREGTHARPA